MTHLQYLSRRWVFILALSHVLDAEMQCMNSKQRFQPPEIGEPIQLKFGLKVEKMGVVSATDGTITFDAVEHAQWVDKRLSDMFSLKAAADSYVDTDYLFGTDFLKEIWEPSIHYDKIISKKFTPDAGEVKIGVPSNRISYWRSGTFTFSCKVNLHYFPFDEHTCNIRVYANNLVVDIFGLIEDKEEYFGMLPDQQTADFNFANFNFTADYDVSFTGTELTTIISEHKLSFHMTRKYVGILVTVVLPNITLTVLSWVVFWVDPKSLPQRLSICVALILSQLVLVVGEEKSLTATGDFKLMDLYLTVNFFMNTAAVIESLFASSMAKGVETRIVAYKFQQDQKQKGPSDKEIADPDVIAKPTSIESEGRRRLSYNLIDFISRIVFPLGFILWNIGFFLVITKRV